MPNPKFKSDTAKQSRRLPNLSVVINDFANAPFRLFFLTACLSAMVGASCWTLMFLGFWEFTTDPLNLHAFFFLQSFAGAAYAGFLFTAIPEWLGDATPLGKSMKMLWLLWLISSVIAPFSLPSAMSVMVVFWLYNIFLASRLVWKGKDDRQISVLLFVYSIAAMSVYLCVSAWKGQLTTYLWTQLLHLNLMGVALVTFRISAALGEQALKDGKAFDSRFIPNPFYKNLAVWLFYLLVVSNIMLHNVIVSGWLHLAIAGVMIGRLREWHFWILLKQHYVRWLYITMAVIGIGYAWRGLALIGVSKSAFFNPVLPMHLLSIGGFLLMAFQIFNIAGLRHSDIPLQYPKMSRFALPCLLFGAVSRSVAVGLGGDYLHFAVYLPNGFLLVAFLLYIPVFYRIFIRYPAVPADAD